MQNIKPKLKMAKLFLYSLIRHKFWIAFNGVLISIYLYLASGFWCVGPVGAGGAVILVLSVLPILLLGVFSVVALFGVGVWRGSDLKSLSATALVISFAWLLSWSISYWLINFCNGQINPN